MKAAWYRIDRGKLLVELSVGLNIDIYIKKYVSILN